MFSDNQQLFLVISIACLVAGVYFLQRAWARGSDLNIAAGWILLLASALLWLASPMSEVGIATILTAGSIVAYAFVLVNVQLKKRKGASKERTSADDIVGNGIPISRTLIRVMLAGPLALMASIGVSAVFFATLNDPIVNGFIIGLIVGSIVWGALISWSVSDTRLSRPTLGTLAVIVSSFGVAILLS